MKQRFRTAIAVSLTLIGSACTPAVEVRYVMQPLSRPERPVLPHITAEEWMAMPADVYRRAYARDRLRREYAESLEAIIDSTQPKVEHAGR